MSLSPSPRTQAGASQSGRKVLLAVDASAESEDALQWTLANMYRPGDVLHFLHIVPRQEPATTYGAPPVDFLPQQNPKSVQRLAEQGLSFIKERLLPMLGDMQPEPVVHIVKVWITVLADNARCLLRTSLKNLQQQGTNRFTWIFAVRHRHGLDRQCGVPESRSSCCCGCSHGWS